MLLAGGVVWLQVDRRASEEMAALARCREGGLEVVQQAERRLALVARAGYVTAQVPGTRDEFERSLRDLLAAEAARQSSPVQSALDRCRAVALLPVWLMGSGRREARSAYVALLEAERERLQRIADDGSAFGTGPGDIARLRERAEDRMRTAA